MDDREAMISLNRLEDTLRVFSRNIRDYKALLSRRDIQPPSFPYSTLPEGLFSSHFCEIMVVLVQQRRVKIVQGQNPIDSWIFHDNHAKIHRYHTVYNFAVQLYNAIPNATQPEQILEGHGILSPVLVNIQSINNGQAESVARCSSWFEKKRVEYWKLLFAYEWATSKRRIRRSLGSGEIDPFFVQTDCIKLFQIYLKWMIGRFLMKNHQLWAEGAVDANAIFASWRDFRTRDDAPRNHM